MGLLDTFFGNADQTQAMGLLGAAMASGQGFGQGAGLAMNHLAGAEGRKRKSLLEDMQMQNMQSEIETRRIKAQREQRQQEMVRSLFPGMGGQAAPGGAPGAPSAAGGGDIMALSQQLGIPPQAIQSDLVFNGGKGISEMLFKRGAPDMQVTNGYAYDKNRMGPGYLPQLNTSQDGKTSMVQIGPDGMPIVSAPQGAFNTFAGYQNIQEGVKANHDPVTVTPAGQPPQMTTRGALVRSPQVQGRVTPAQQAARDTDRTAILQQELVKAQQQLQSSLQSGDQSGAARAQADIAALNRELGGRSASVGMPLQSEEEKLRSQKGVEGDAKMNEARSKDVKTAEKFLSIANQAEQILNTGPTASGFGSAVDKAAAFFGKTTDGAVAATQLKAIGGWLVANVPRMEGPQSNFDVGNYQVMAADVANDSLPVDRRLAALQTIKTMMENVREGGPSRSFDPKPGKPAANLPQPMKGMVRNGYRFKGGDPSKQENWEKQ